MKIPLEAPSYSDVFPDSRDRFDAILRAKIGAADNGKYRHWDTIRHITPPYDLTTREWWFGIKNSRRASYKILPLVDTKDIPFQYAPVELMYMMLREIDIAGAGSIAGDSKLVDSSNRDKYILRTLGEEAITSSQLEGASTTRDVAKEMLRTGREPGDKSERMIYNNYHAMLYIRENKHEKITIQRVEELHSIITDGTLKNPDDIGRFRTSDDISIYDERDNLLHKPPPAVELPARLQAMCDFANEVDMKTFIHPVVRAIIIHFWLAYDHPFVDGNGRTARALFYWSMARSNYWLLEFIAISRIIKKAPSKYAKAFLYTETDENDLTYFILNQIDVVIKAIEDLHKYLRSKDRQLRALQSMPVNADGRAYNKRQLTLLAYALEHPDTTFTIASHQLEHGVSYLTARADLLELMKYNFLESIKHGKTLHFHVPNDLRERLTQG